MEKEADLNCDFPAEWTGATVDKQKRRERRGRKRREGGEGRRRAM